MVHIGVGCEKVLQNVVVFGTFFFKRKVEFQDLNSGEVIVHVMAESHLTIVLLLRSHLTVLHLLHQHDFLLLGSDEHQHFCGEITALERILTKETERFQVWHVGVK